MPPKVTAAPWSVRKPHGCHLWHITSKERERVAVFWSKADADFVVALINGESKPDQENQAVVEAHVNGAGDLPSIREQEPTVTSVEDPGAEQRCADLERYYGEQMELARMQALAEAIKREAGRP